MDDFAAKVEAMEKENNELKKNVAVAAAKAEAMARDVSALQGERASLLQGGQASSVKIVQLETENKNKAEEIASVRCVCWHALALGVRPRATQSGPHWPHPPLALLPTPPFFAGAASSWTRAPRTS